MKWVQGDIIGHGSYSTVRIARPKKQTPRFPEIMAVKSSTLSHADMLLHEKTVLKKLKDSPHIIRGFGHDYTKEKGVKTYNLFLEYASGGTLADKLKKQTNNRFQESEVRRYTKSILEGVQYIHENGYVHRDLKLENVLVCPSSGNDTLKIADFGLARKSWKKKKREIEELGGTLLYLSPEALAKSEQEPPADVWAIGCMVAEMLIGAPMWQCRPGEDVIAVLMRIALCEEIPEIPVDLSKQGKDFLGKIFIKNPAKRWTAKQLMDHPFVSCEEEAIGSPKGPFDWTNGYESKESTCSLTNVPSTKSNKVRVSFADKFRRLLTCQGRDWSVSNHGITPACTEREPSFSNCAVSFF